jgi:hypothetical protein
MNSGPGLLVAGVGLTLFTLLVFFTTKCISAGIKAKPEEPIAPSVSEKKPPDEKDKEWENPLIL